MSRYYSVSQLVPIDGRASFWVIHYRRSKTPARCVDTFEQLPREAQRELKKRYIVPMCNVMETGTSVLNYRIAEF